MNLNLSGIVGSAKFAGGGTMPETNIKSAFDDVYEALDELIDWLESDKIAKEQIIDSRGGSRIYSISHSVLSYWKKLRGEP